MNIQIFGTKKNFDSKKAERYFKERGIKYQFIDMKEKGLSKGEFQSCAQLRVCSQAGGIPVYPRFSQPDNSESWDDVGNGI